MNNLPSIDISQGMGIQLTKRNSEITRIYPAAIDKKNKIFIRNYSLLGDENALVEKHYEEVLFVLLEGKAPSRKELLNYKSIISRAYQNTSHATNKLLNIPDFLNKPLMFLQMLILSFAYNKKLTNIEIIVKVFIVGANLFNKYFDRDSVVPDSKLGIIENLLYMIGKNPKDQVLVKSFSRMMIGWIDLGLAPSAVATRVSASSRADVISSVVAGVGNATGAKHTSARVDAMKLLISLKILLTENNILSIDEGNRTIAKNIIHKRLQEMITQQSLVPGFGHYIFKGLTDNSIDPRIYLVEHAIKDLYPNDNMLSIVNIMREIFREGILFRNKKEFILPPNSDIYWAAFLYNFLKSYGSSDKICSIASLFTILTRVSGLLIHDIEQRVETASMKAWGWIIE